MMFIGMITKENFVERVTNLSSYATNNHRGMECNKTKSRPYIISIDRK